MADEDGPNTREASLAGLRLGERICCLIAKA